MKQAIDGGWWSLDDLKTLQSDDVKWEISAESQVLIKKCREYLDKEIAERDEPVYGITTGFGSLCNTVIPKEDINKLQINLVRSHACGVGEMVPVEIVRLMLLLKAKGLSYGHSGVALTTVNRILELLNNKVYPVIFEQGSLGASGDLAPLAHLALGLVGEGNAHKAGSIIPMKDVYDSINLDAIELQSKEGLALLNGTQFMSAYATLCTIKSRQLVKWADCIAVMSLEAFDGRPEPFTHNVHAVRAHNGQMATAERFRNLLKNSELIARKKEHVQDPYSFRCAPQVHGASKDALEYVVSVVEREINSVTDNPTIFPDEDMIISAGNFHGQPLALALDHLAIAMAEIGSISERRTYKLIGGTRGLPAFLVANPGINSGFMISQYAAASVVSQNKQLCTPASVDTIDSSNGQEDHVSMGANAATKAYRVIENVEKVLAIELLHASQALDFRRPAKSSEAIEKLHAAFREKITFTDADRYLHEDIQSSISFLREYSIDDVLGE